MSRNIRRNYRRDSSLHRIWPWVKQWRGIYFLFWHESITHAYLVVEDLSGDLCTPDKIKRMPLAQVIQDIWVHYCLGDSEEASLYEIDLTELPNGLLPTDDP
ncbi:MAG: hypothetical protein GXP27_22645 [Planctomycetes bacterium]|nr:hypothetical protein [Planctomycetota bacterium]